MTTRAAPAPPRLFERDLLVVIGKGGVGKSTVAAALGLAAARRGRRAIVAEVAGRDDVARALGAAGGYRPHELAPRLRHVSIDHEHALAEYLHRQLPLLAGLLIRSDTFRLFTGATPGMQELLSIGKVARLTRPPRRARRTSELVILDAPATGHGLALLAAPRMFAAAARAGPVAHQAGAIDALLRSPARTAFVVVAAPAEMAVSEALTLRAGLDRELGQAPARIVMNGMLPARFAASEAPLMRAAHGDPAVASARWFERRSRGQRAQLARLRRGAGQVPVRSLPFVFAEALGRDGLEHLSRILERER